MRIKVFFLFVVGFFGFSNSHCQSAEIQDLVQMDTMSDASFFRYLKNKGRVLLFSDSAFQQEFVSQLSLRQVDFLMNQDDERQRRFFIECDSLVKFWTGNKEIQSGFLSAMCSVLSPFEPNNENRKEYCEHYLESSAYLLQPILLKRGYALKEIASKHRFDCYSIRDELYEGCEYWKYFIYTETPMHQEYEKLYVKFIKQLSKCYGDNPEALEPYYITPFVYNLFPEGTFD